MLTKNILLKICLGLVSCSFLIPSISQANEKVVLQLKWTHAFQFAGYYAAKELGYYQDAGLDVEIREATPKIDPVEEVVSGRAEYGVGNTNLLLARQNGKPVVVLNVVFQHSPVVLITRGKGQITSVKDLVGKRVMIEPNSSELFVYLRKLGVPLEQIQTIEHSFKVDELIQGDVYAITAYSNYEPYLLNKKGYFFKIFTPREAGIDFYGDNLFTTEGEIKNHAERVEAFRLASMKGWVYAMDHEEEIIDLIFEKYAVDVERRHLLFEAQKMNDLLVNNLIEIGYMNHKRWQSIVDAYASIGLIKNENILDGFIYESESSLLDIIKANYTVLLTFLAAVILLFAFLIYRNKQLHQFNQTLEQIAETDQLTGIYNRKRLDELLKIEFDRWLRYKRQFSIIISDIDKFKSVNDNHGHQVGDEVIRTITRSLSSQIRVSDTLGRWGGEEFMLICPETDSKAATRVAENLRQAVEEQKYENIGKMTASFGVASIKDGETVFDIVKRADDALYEAKRTGRNKLVVSNS